MRLPNVLQEDLLRLKVNKYNPEFDIQGIDFKGLIGSKENFGENLEIMKNNYPGLNWENPHDPREMARIRADAKKDEKLAFEDYYNSSLEDLKNMAKDMGFKLLKIKVENKIKPTKAKTTKNNKVKPRIKINWENKEEASTARGMGLDKRFKTYPKFADS